MPTQAAPTDRPTWPFHLWKHDVLERALKMGAKLETLDEVLGHVCNDGSTRANLWWRSHEKTDEAARMAVALCGDPNRVSTPEEAMAFLRRQLLGGGS